MTFEKHINAIWKENEMAPTEQKGDDLVRRNEKAKNDGR
jgi:hypothetical protein